MKNTLLGQPLSSEDKEAEAKIREHQMGALQICDAIIDSFKLSEITKESALDFIRAVLGSTKSDLDFSPKGVFVYYYDQVQSLEPLSTVSRSRASGRSLSSFSKKSSDQGDW
jgi:hypothetical protein